MHFSTDIGVDEITKLVAFLYRLAREFAKRCERGSESRDMITLGDAMRPVLRKM